MDTLAIDEFGSALVAPRHRQPIGNLSASALVNHWLIVSVEASSSSLVAAVTSAFISGLDEAARRSASAPRDSLFSRRNEALAKRPTVVLTYFLPRGREPRGLISLPVIAG